MREKRRSVMNIGTSSMIVILICLCFAVLAALALSSAHNDYELSAELADHTSNYYEASNIAYERLANEAATLYEERDPDTGEVRFTVPMSDAQELAVCVVYGSDETNYVVTQWQVCASETWEGDDTIPGLLTLDE